MAKKKEKKYPELIHIRVNEEMMKILKDQKNYSEFIRQRITEGKCQEDLEFLKSLFKDRKVKVYKAKLTKEEDERLHGL